MNRIVIKNSLYILIIFFFFASCKTFNQPNSVVEKLDYTNVDVVEGEIRNIREIGKIDPIKALMRAIKLENDEIIQEYLQLNIDNFNKAIEEKDFYTAKKISQSIKAASSHWNFNNENLTEELLSYSYYMASDIPGFVKDEEKLPKTISDCIDATVTIWVDKGLKVENGAGVQDIIIGSGFFIDRRGYLITNYHVIQDLVDPTYEGYSRLYIKLTSDMESKIPALVVGYDSIIDLALLKVEIEPEFIFELGDSSDLNVGDKISVIGTPIGLEGTLTSGIISSTNRSLSALGNYFQIDAAVNSGNSGGPLIDENRKVQAIIFAGIMQYQGLNFAIPVEYLKQELEYLYKGGEFCHNWIAAYGKTKKHKDIEKGIEVFYVMPGGSADFADIHEGCIITKINDREITSLESFQFELMKYQRGSLINCHYVSSAGEEKIALIYLEKRPHSPLVEIYNSDFISDSFYPIFGMKMARSSTTYRNSYTITHIIPGSIADENGFSVGDPIVVRDVKFDNEYKYLVSQIYVKRKKRGFLDIVMGIGSPFDVPNYF